MKLYDSTKRISFAILLALFLFISVSSIYAVDVNETVIDSSDDIALSVEENDQLEANNESEINEDSSEQDSKNQTELTSPTSKIYYNGNYQVTLIDSNSGNALANKAIKFSINNVDYSAKTNSKGVASVKLKLNPGSYLATAIFAGDDDFNASNSLSTKFKVLTTIKAKDISKYYKGSKKYQATYLNSNGNVLKNKKVTISVNGKKYTAKTNSKGVASLAVNLKPGTYKVATTNPTTGEQLTTTFKILSTVTASNFKKVKGDSKRFLIKFFKSNGKPLAKTKVKIKIKSKTYTYRTYANGKLRLTLNSLNKGTYKVVCYNPDGLSKTCTVQIYSLATTKVTTSSYTFFANETKTIKVKLTTALDDNSNAGKVIDIVVDNKAYSKKTDSNGEISFNLPSLSPGVHNLDCEFYGTKFFKSSFVSRYVTILGTSDTQFSADDVASIGSFAGTPFSVVLGAGDVPLMQKTVSFEINGKTFTGKTDNSGLASIPIDLDVGNYTVSYKFSGDSKLKSSSGSSTISVFERANTTLTCSYKSSYKDTLQTFDVYLKDSNGTPISLAYVELSIAGKTYEGRTDANGHAVVNAVAPVGKYQFSIKFKGDNDYNFSSTSGTTTVTLSKYANGINEKNGAASSAYLQATKNCQVNNAKIKSLVKSLTKDLTSDMDKARVLFEYVQLNIKYKYYFDTEKGAVKTLESLEGNGADHAHLLIAMYRAAGLKARYVHGSCTMVIDKKTFGHVWTQVLVDNTWICGDTTDLANKLGSISSWNVNKFTLWNKYLELPF
ncbi:transglutaminase domain-containing protein [Methanobrevibacter sp.]|uniref:transglutaminase-like domain-containing protein n=1 Tax=Methanobrevibacter sp. TaxID=66852 RepID=UPI00388F3605